MEVVSIVSSLAKNRYTVSRDGLGPDRMLSGEQPFDLSRAISKPSAYSWSAVGTTEKDAFIVRRPYWTSVDSDIESQLIQPVAKKMIDPYICLPVTWEDREGDPRPIRR